MSPPANSRESIIDAAEVVVLESGARHMTLEAVASRVGVSKGGLLYHFPTKEALLKAMLERFSKQIDEIREKKAQGLKEGPRRAIKAFILSIAHRDPKKEQIGSALLAAVAHNPELLRPARDDFRIRLKEFVRSGLNFKRAAVIIFAAHGLIFSELLSFSHLSIKERKDFIDELLHLADQ